MLLQIDAPVGTVALRHCEHCKNLYAFHKSTSRYLKFTYCSASCEIGALGFSIEAALLMEHKVVVSEVVSIEAIEEKQFVPFELSQSTDDSGHEEPDNDGKVLVK